MRNELMVKEYLKLNQGSFEIKKISNNVFEITDTQCDVNDKFLLEIINGRITCNNEDVIVNTKEAYNYDIELIKKIKEFEKKWYEFKKGYDFKFVKFLSNKNVIKVTNNIEFELFKQILKKLNMLGCLKKYETFIGWQKLAIINDKNPKLFLFEFDNNKGLTWDDNVRTSTIWFDEPPLDVKEVYDELF